MVEKSILKCHNYLYVKIWILPIEQSDKQHISYRVKAAVYWSNLPLYSISNIQYAFNACKMRNAFWSSLMVNKVVLISNRNNHGWNIKGFPVSIYIYGLKKLFKDLRIKFYLRFKIRVPARISF